MKVCTLFTGSAGNATLITSGHAKILVDCGITIGALKRSLGGLDICIEELDAVLISHEHGDHASEAVASLERLGIAVYAHEKCAPVLADKVALGSIKTFSGSFGIKDLCIDTLSVKHDAAHTSAFRIVENKTVFTLMTDTGVVPKEFDGFVRNSALVLIESNHDTDMLLYGEYPISLKKRILSDYGHLSNAQCAEALKFMPGLNVKRIFLGHLSEVNNTAELAFAAALNALNEIGAHEGKDVTVEAIPQGVSSGYIDLDTL